jgi:signal transduction histidine kinase
LNLDRVVFVALDGETFSAGLQAERTSNDFIAYRDELEISPSVMPTSVVPLVLKNHQTLVLEQSSIRQEYLKDSYFLIDQPKNGLFVPLVRKQKVMALLYGESRSDKLRIDEAELFVINSLAAQAAVSIENAWLYQSLHRENTELRKTEHLLRRSEALLEEGERISNTGAWTWNAETGEMQWSEQVYKIWGFANTDGPPSFEELMRRVQPSDREKVVGLHAKALVSEVEENIYEVEFSISSPAGMTRRLQLVFRPWSQAGARPRLYIGTTADVTERRAAQDATRRSEAQLAEAQKLSNIGSLSWGAGSRTLYCSAQARRILDVNDTQTVTIDHMLQWTYLHDADKVESCFAPQANYEETILQEFRFYCGTGELRYLKMAARLIQSAAGTSEYVGALADITESRKAQNALMEAQANLTHETRVSVLDELTTSITDQMNQLLASIISNGGAGILWLDRPVPSLAEASQSFAEIIRSAQRTNQLMIQIKSFSRRRQDRKRIIDLQQTIEEAIAFVRQKLDQLSITLRTEFRLPGPKVRADHTKIQQVLIGILTNSIQSIECFTCAEIKDICIGINCVADETVRVSVADSGAGLSVEAKNRIFEPFFSTKPEGLGLGLSVARSTIQDHDGTINLLDTGMRGATFYFDLPLVSTH